MPITVFVVGICGTRSLVPLGAQLWRTHANMWLGTYLGRCMRLGRCIARARFARTGSRARRCPPNAAPTYLPT